MISFVSQKLLPLLVIGWQFGPADGFFFLHFGFNTDKPADGIVTQWDFLVLQSVLIDNEDLQAAAVSLSKLLQDIEQPQVEEMEQPSLEQSNQDAFAGTSVQESTANVPDLAENGNKTCFNLS